MSDQLSIVINLQSPQAIERDHSSVEARFRAVLKKWVRRTTPSPSWSALARALKSPVINRGDIAKKIEARMVSPHSMITVNYQNCVLNTCTEGDW